MLDKYGNRIVEVGHEFMGLESFRAYGFDFRAKKNFNEI
jgi:hypothetical protein